MAKKLSLKAPVLIGSVTSSKGDTASIGVSLLMADAKLDPNGAHALFVGASLKCRFDRGDPKQKTLPAEGVEPEILTFTVDGKVSKIGLVGDTCSFTVKMGKDQVRDGIAYGFSGQKARLMATRTGDAKDAAEEEHGEPLFDGGDDTDGKE